MVSMFGIMVLMVALAPLAMANVDTNDDYFDRLEFLPGQMLRPPFFPVGNKIHNWRFTGHSIAAQDYVRLTSMLKGQSGVLWNDKSIDGTQLDVFYELKIHGDALGADGMALWLTDTPVNNPGPYLGGPNKWKGVAVALDTFDNNAKGDNPRVSIVANDGSKFVNKDNDALELDQGGCVYGFRNLDKGVMVHVKYANGLMDVSIGNKDMELETFHSCAKDISVNLPKQVYLSVSADTGGLVDNHDVLSITAFTDIKDDEDDHHDDGDKDHHDDADKDHHDDDEKDHHADNNNNRKSAGRKKDYEEPSDEELEKGLPEHHTKPPLAFHFSNIFADLKDIHKPEHPDYAAFKEDLRLGEAEKLKNDEERFGFALDSIFTMEEHTDLMIKAFERVLGQIDNERFRVQQNHHQFAEAFNAMYEQVATKKDVEEALQTLSGKRSLLKASRKIHKLIDHALDSVEGSESPLGKLGVIAKEMDPHGQEMTSRHSRNRLSLSRAQAEISGLMKLARESGGMTTLDWIIIVEILLFVIFVVFQLTKKKQKASIL